MQAYVIDLLLHESSRLWHMLLGSWNCTSTHITHLSSFWKEYEMPQIFTMVCFWYVSSVYEYFQSEYFIPLDICIMSSENVNQEKKMFVWKWAFSIDSEAVFVSYVVSGFFTVGITCLVVPGISVLIHLGHLHVVYNARWFEMRVKCPSPVTTISLVEVFLKV